MTKLHPMFTQRAAGVLLHATSLPGGHGIGDLGPGARTFINWMRSSGLSLWQMLPIGPVGRGNSPYSGRSAFAGEPLLISIHELIKDGLLPASSARCPAELNGARTRYAAARRFKLPRFRTAFKNFHRSSRPRSKAYQSFLASNRSWLHGWCDAAGGEPDEQIFLQYIFDRQWKSLRRYANRRNVRLVGDLPIFVDVDCADMQQHPELFLLDQKGHPKSLTGAPPDDFSRDGQLWGHPHYRWSAHRHENWKWWTSRFRQAFQRFDSVRLDHFLGFVRLWHIPIGERTARNGRWQSTPGRELLEVLEKRLGRLPIIAEDLGVKTSAVDRLRDDFGFPGMRILQWAFGSPDSSDLPHNHPVHSVVYPGTHDNETATGWLRYLGPEERARFKAYAGPMNNPAEGMTRLAFTSPAVWAICQMQDLLALSPGTRMNRPGVPSGNWTWRLSPGKLSNQQAKKIRLLSSSTGRISGAHT